MFGRLTLRCAFYRPTKPVTPWRSLAGFSRYLSSVSHQDEIVSVPIGGNGAVKFTISRPTQPTNNNNVLVHIPPGPTLDTSHANHSLVTSKILKDAFPSTTIVDIQYRISLLEVSNQRGSKSLDKHNDAAIPDYRFPTPIHDVFTAWDYITDDLQLYNHDIVNGKKAYHEPRICLLGSHIGGALALSLALTNPESVTAVAVLDGLVDWVGLDEIAAGDERMNLSEKEAGTNTGTGIGADAAQQKEKRKNKTAEREAQRVAARELIRLRRRLFRSHSGYFDPFASPVLFLRAPGRDTPIEPMGNVDGTVKGHVMRYGDERGEVAIVESGNGNGEAFGPYDDDWHSHLSEGEAHLKKRSSGLVERGADGYRMDTRSSIDSNNTNVTVDDSSSDIASPSNSDSTTPPSSPDQPPTSPRRRKVLRRWPPTAHPEDVLLPYVNIFSTTSSSITSGLRPTTPKTHDHSQSIDILPVLNLQAAELQELLRKACFWGRERSIAEERVTLSKIETVKSGDEGEKEMEGDGTGSGLEEVFEWLRERFRA